MTINRPQGRKRGETTGSANVHKRGSGLGIGKTGNSSHRPSGLGSGSGSSGGVHLGGNRPGKGGGGVTRGVGGIGVVALVLMLLFGRSGSADTSTNTNTSGGQSSTPSAQTSGYSFGTATSHTTYTDASYSTADTSVSKKARDKYTEILGGGKDEVTILVYMCGADLESKYGMATSDLTEMAYATQSDKVNIIVETGGAKSWKTSAISNSVLQRWKVTEKAIEPLDKNVGKGAMTDPTNLEEFIKWGVKAYPANRYELIFWDHGGGSVSGYGCDELYPNGSMSVDEISSALKNAGVKFDFVGFDACLMANYETAVALQPYADYLIASEEPEPGTGWYYTTWLTDLAKNSSMSTLDVGKEIVDTFIETSKKSSGSSALTLSVVDLAELQGTATNPFTTFAKDLSTAIQSESYKTVADARSCAKEYASSMKIDQIDLIHFCDKLNTKSSTDLAKVLRSAIKYNQTYNSKNSYGLSIYFPYSNTRMVSNVVKVYDNLGFDSAYTGAVKSFGTLAASGNVYNNSTQNSLYNVLGGGQVSNGQSYSASDLFGLLSGLSSGGQSSSSSSSGYGAVVDLVSLLGGGSSSVDTSSLELFAQLLSGRAALPAEDFVLSEVDGQTVLRLSEDEWAEVHDVALNVWVDDGEGYIDLGLDSIYHFNDEGDLIVDYDGIWPALDRQPVSYYVTTSEYVSDDDYRYGGYIPAYLNGEQVRILVEWSDENPNGAVLGAEAVTENNTLSKGLITIEDGDVIDLLCDYYTYDGEYQDTYYLGESITVDGELEFSEVNITNDHYVYCYRLTDTLNNERWTPAVIH